MALLTPGPSETRKTPLPVLKTAPAAGVGFDLALEDIVLADEGGDEAIGRAVVDLLGRRHLLQPAMGHHRHPVGHGERLTLIVGDVDEGDIGALLDGAQLGPHVLAQLQIQRRQRLIEQHDLGLDGERAGDGDALLLPARELADGLVGRARQVDQAEQFLGPGPARRLGDAADLETEGDVLPDRHEGEERQVLEDQDGRALVGADVAHILAADVDRALARHHEAGDHPQDGRLAAAGGPEEGEELSRLDRDRRLVDRPEAAEIGRYAVEVNAPAHCFRISPAVPNDAFLSCRQSSARTAGRRCPAVRARS